jgi:ATP-binding cassette subfamily F protein 3
VVSGFSGGERSRLALAKLLLEPRNLLFLDEPTNHLDIPAAEILEEALVGFEGTVILVSHDRRFLENVTTRIVSVRDGHVDVYPGGFRDYVATLKKDRAPAADEGGERSEKGGAGAPAPTPRAEARRAPSARPAEGAPGTPRPREASASDADKRKDYEAQRQQARAFEKKKKRVQELEKLISAGEKDLDTMRAKLRESPGGDWEKLAQMAREEQALTKKVDAMLMEWAQLSEEIPS